MLKRILLAATVGAVVGTLVALELTPLFWWVGTIVGFVVGYVAYDPVTVVSATKTAYLKAVAWRPKAGWQMRWKTRARVFLIGQGISTWIVFGVFLLIRLMEIFTHEGGSTVPASVWFMLIGSAHGASLLIALSMTAGISSERLTQFYVDSRKECIYWNFITTPFTALYFVIYFLVKYSWLALFWVGVGLFMAIIFTPNALRAMGRGLRTFFITLVYLIHSHARMVAGMSGATGTVVGYFTGSATVGGIAGFATGLAAWGVTLFLIKHLPAPVRVS